MNNAEFGKKLLLIGIVATIILFTIILIILFVLIGIDNKKTKIIFKGKTYKTTTTEVTLQIPEGKETSMTEGVYQKLTMPINQKDTPIMLIAPDGTTYYCIETIANMAGYKYNNGVYSETTTPDESKDKCYVDNGGEYVNFIAEENSISKFIKTSEQYKEELEQVKNYDKNIATEGEEVFHVEKDTIKFADEKLYASEEAIAKGLNIMFSRNKNMITIYTINDLTGIYSKQLSEKGYSLTPNFKNQRGLYENLAVVGKDKKYGVIKIDGQDNKEIISVKYDSVEYVQSIGAFIISSDSKFGMIKPGEETPTIPLQYSDIKLIDVARELYMVELSGKYGVINAQGEDIVPVEFDKIGIDDASVYSLQGIHSKYLIEDTIIPVLSDGLYGLYNVEGTRIQEPKYTSIGCSDPATLINDTRAMPTLVVPLSDEVNAIVYSRRNNAGQILYGLLGTDGTTIQHTYYTAIYYIINNGKSTYYVNRIDDDESIMKLSEFVNNSNAAKQYIENHTKQNSGKHTSNESETDEERMERIETEGAEQFYNNPDENQEENPEENREENESGE